jgi:anti-sigma-K factor RskA
VNIQDYISSGIVESYVLGLADAGERAEFEQLCRKYPELVKAREQFEEQLEKQALANAVKPPASAREKVLAAVQESAAQSSKKIPAMETTTTPVRSMNTWRWVAAASIVLLAFSAWFAYDARQKNADLAATNRELQSRIDSADNLLQRIVEERNNSRKNEAIVVNLEGTKNAPKSSASVFWDSASANVYLIVQNMPKLPSGKQYQLWAIIDKVPKDLGVFDVKDNNMIIKMQGVQKAEAFAITIEKQGGSPTPTLDSMQVMGAPKRGL